VQRNQTNQGMTIEQLLECPVEQWESLTQKQIEEWFSPLLKITRPEMAEKPIMRHGKRKLEQPTFLSDKQKEAMHIAEQYGFKLKF